MNGTAKNVENPFLLIRSAKRMKNCVPQGYRDHSTIIPLFKI